MLKRDNHNLNFKIKNLMGEKFPKFLRGLINQSKIKITKIPYNQKSKIQMRGPKGTIIIECQYKIHFYTLSNVNHTYSVFIIM